MNRLRAIIWIDYLLEDDDLDMGLEEDILIGLGIDEGVGSLAGTLEETMVNWGIRIKNSPAHVEEIEGQERLF